MEATINKSKASRGPGLLESTRLFLTEFNSKPLEMVDRLHKEYGEIVTLKLGSTQVFMLSNPEHYDYVLRKNSDNYKKLKKVENDTKELFGKDWIHAANRKMLMPYFKAARFEMMGSIVIDEVQALIERWHKKCELNQEIDIESEMFDVSLGIVSRSLISTDFGSRRDEFFELIKTVVHMLGERTISLFALPLSIPTSQNKRYLNSVDKVLAHIQEVVDERRASGENKSDLLDTLMSATYELTGEKLDPQLLCQRIAWMLVPASEPMVRGLTWMWYLLAQNPSSVNRLHDEVDSLEDGAPSYKELNRLSYSKGIVQESMRLYPPFWMLGRQALNEDNIGGEHIPGGSMVLFNAYVMQRTEKYWENAEIFDPDRFLPERMKGRPASRYVPFSIGNRGCLGQSLSIMSMQYVLAMVAQNFQLELIDSTPVEPCAALTLMPERKLKFKLSKRA